MTNTLPVYLIVRQEPGYTIRVHLFKKPDLGFFDAHHLPIIRIQDKIHKVSP